MSKNKNIKKILTEEKVYEKYILLILAIVAIVLGILSLTGVLQFTDDKIMEVEPWIIALMLIGFGILSLVLSLKSLLIDFKNNKKVLKPVHQEIIDLYKNDKISEIFMRHNLVFDDCRINKDKSLMIIIKLDATIDVFLDVIDNSYKISFEFTDEFFDNLTEEKKLEFDNIIDKFEEISSVTYDLDNNTKLEKILENIKLFVENNLEQIKNSF